MKKVQKNTEKLTRGSEDPEESERGLHRYSVQGTCLNKRKQTS